MIRVFSQTDKDFTSNGDVVIKPLKAKVHKEDNGDYYLEIETDNSYFDYLIAGNIIVANTPQGDQAFRLTNPSKSKNKIQVKAWHVFYDSENYLIDDSYVVEKNCKDALIHLNNATEPASEFSMDSDIQVVDSYRCIRESLYKAIETVREKWGGHLVRNNFNIALKKSIGVDNGVIIQYKKNLKEMSCDESWDNVVTKLMPVGKDGILLNYVDPSASKYLLSDVQYDIPFTKAVSFNQEIDRDDYPTDAAYNQALVDDLRAQGQKYLDEHCKPDVNYTLKAHLEKITDIGDIIEVRDQRIGVDIMTSVIAFDYDCILKKYTQIEFGNFKPVLSNLMQNIMSDVDYNIFNQITNQLVSITDQQIDDIINGES